MQFKRSALSTMYKHKSDKFKNIPEDKVRIHSNKELFQPLYSVLSVDNMEATLYNNSLDTANNSSIERNILEQQHSVTIPNAQ